MVKAIDIHVHPVNRPSVEESERQRQMAQYFRGEPTPQDPEGFYQYYKERDMMAVLLVTGPVKDRRVEPNHNDWSEELMDTYPDTFIGFGGVDPKQGKLAVKEADALRRGAGPQGLQVPPAEPRPSSRTTRTTTSSGARSATSACRRCSTPARPASAPDSPARTASRTSTAARTPTSTTSRPTSRSSRSSWRTRPSPGWTSSSRSAASRPTSGMDLSGWSPKYFSPNLIQYVQHAAARTRRCSAATSR